MTQVMTGSQAELIALWREVLTARGWSHRELDDRAGLGEGYTSKILCGLRTPSAPTIARINQALGITLQPCWSNALTP
jgi:transcriptional regulator with XRE-family HTH domain